MRTILNKLRNGKVLIGFCSMYPVAGIIEKIGSDWDWIWIDMQHGQHDYQSLLAAVRTADFVGIESLVRIPGHDSASIGLALDTGASGVIVPQVETREQAERIVEAAKFPPLGRRSFGGRRPIDLSGRSYAHTANESVALVVQIESRTGFTNAKDILATAGIDAFFFGPDDMAIGDGLPMDQARPADTYQSMIKELADLGRQFSVIAGGSFGTPEETKNAIEFGYRLIGTGSDSTFLSTSSKNHRERMRESCGI